MGKFINPYEAIKEGILKISDKYITFYSKTTEICSYSQRWDSDYDGDIYPVEDPETLLVRALDTIGLYGGMVTQIINQKEYKIEFSTKEKSFEYKMLKVEKNNENNNYCVNIIYRHQASSRIYISRTSNWSTYEKWSSNDRLSTLGLCIEEQKENGWLVINYSDGIFLLCREFEENSKEKVQYKIWNYLLKKGIPSDFLYEGRFNLDKWPFEVYLIKIFDTKYPKKDERSALDKFLGINVKITNPVAVILCTNFDSPIFINDFERIEEYSNIKNISIYGISNGLEKVWYLKNAEGLYERIEEFNTLEELIAKKSLKITENKINLFLNTPKYNFSSEFPNKLIPLTDNLLQLFKNESNLVEYNLHDDNTFEDYSIEISKELIIEKLVFKNGQFIEGNYRFYKIKTFEFSNISLGICLYVNKKIAFLHVLYKMEGEIQRSMQINLNNRVSLNNNMNFIWTDGGFYLNETRIDSKIIQNFIKKIYPELIVKNFILLGKLDTSRKFCFENEDIQGLFSNLIKYIICQYKYIVEINI
jgi:hypothetical protein